MDDVFGGIPGGPGDVPDAGAHDGAGVVDVPALEEVLDGAALLGVELEPRFRVLAATFEPSPDRDAWAAREDRRIQLLCFPVSTILASLRRETDDARELLSFDEAQLVDVVAAMSGATVTGPLFGRPEPRPGSWGPRFSMEGRSTAPDGTSRTLTIAVRDGELTLDLFARFDDLELKDATGETLHLTAAPEG